MGEEWLVNTIKAKGWNQVTEAGWDQFEEVAEMYTRVDTFLPFDQDFVKVVSLNFKGYMPPHLAHVPPPVPPSFTQAFKSPFSYIFTQFSLFFLNFAARKFYKP